MRISTNGGRKKKKRKTMNASDIPGFDRFESSHTTGTVRKKKIKKK